MTLPTPTRGHAIRNGGSASLPIPAAASGNVTVTDLATLTVVPSSAYLVLDDAVTRLSGVWAPGSGRWLVEYDVDGSEEPPPVNIFPGLVEDDELEAKMAAVAAGDNAFSVAQRVELDKKVVAVTAGAKLWIGTREAYDALGTEDATTLYAIVG